MLNDANSTEVSKKSGEISELRFNFSTHEISRIQLIRSGFCITSKMPNISL